MIPNLNIQVQELSADKKYQVVTFNGEFDKAGHTEIRELLDSSVKAFDGKNLVFDFSALKFINSEGIGYIMEIHTHLIQRDRQLVLVGLNDHVKDVFETIGISEIISVYPTLNDFLNKA